MALVAKLKRLKERYGNRLSDKAVKKVADEYKSTVRRPDNSEGELNPD